MVDMDTTVKDNQIEISKEQILKAIDKGLTVGKYDLQLVYDPAFESISVDKELEVIKQSP